MSLYWRAREVPQPFYDLRTELRDRTMNKLNKTRVSRSNAPAASPSFAIER